MKKFVLIAAFAASTAAMAQTMPTQTTPPTDSMEAGKPGADAGATMPSDTGAMPMNSGAPANPSAPMAPDSGAMPMAPPAASAPMPNGGMSNGGMAGGGMAATPSDKSYQVCSRTVTDNCRNRGGR